MPYPGELEEDEDELKAIKEKRSEDNKFKKDSKHFVSKAERFNYKVKEVAPAPGYYYDPSINTWSKRTYNIHFADF